RKSALHQAFHSLCNAVPDRRTHCAARCANRRRAGFARANATASAGSAAIIPISSGAPSASTTRQPPSDTTGTVPRWRASASSDSVPHDPPTTMTASAERTRITLRASPIFVASTADSPAQAPPRSASGRTPITNPPAREAPSATAAMTPAPPPQSTITPASASNRPTSRAFAASVSVQALGPQTATCTGPQSLALVLVEPFAGGDAEFALVDVILLQERGEALGGRVTVHGDVVRGGEPDDVE